jgi:hypothetical protein
MPEVEASGRTTEIRLKAARTKQENVEVKILARETIEAITVTERSEEQKNVLKAMQSSKLLNEESASIGLAVRDLEKRQIEEKKACAEMDSWIELRVTLSLWELYKGQREKHLEDRIKQVLEGIKEIKQRMIVAPEIVMDSFTATVRSEMTTLSVSIGNALKKTR